MATRDSNRKIREERKQTIGKKDDLVKYLRSEIVWKTAMEKDFRVVDAFARPSLVHRQRRPV